SPRLSPVDADTVELAHEALLRAWPRLTGWLAADRAGLLVHRRLADDTATWLGRGRDPDSLYRGARLADLRAWLADREDHADDLGPAEREFVEASEAAEEAAREKVRHDNRRLRRGIVALAVLTVVAVTAGGVAVWQQRVASAQRAEAVAQQAIGLSRQYAAESRSARDTDPRRSLLLAAAAWETAHTDEARSAVLSAQAVPYRGTLGPADARLFDVALSPDGAVAALATAAGTVTLWDTATHRPITQLTGPDGEYPSLAFSPDGSVLATTHVTEDADKRIRLWDLGTHRLVRALPGQAASVVFSPDGASVVTTTTSAVELWDVAGGTRTRVLAYPRGYLAAEAAISPDGSLVAAGGGDNRVHLWNAATGEEVAVLTGHTKAVFGVHFNHDGTRLASSGADGVVRLWDVRRRQAATIPVLTPPGGTEFIRQVVFSPDGDHVAGGLNAGRTVQLWRLSDGAAVRSFVGHTEAVISLAFSRDGHTLLSGGLDRKAILWDVGTTVLDAPRGVSSVAFSPDGRLLAYAGGAAVTLWDTAARRTVRELTGEQAVTALSFSSDARTLAAAGLDGSVRFWRVGNGELFHTTTFGAGTTAHAIVYSPDGRTLAAVSGPAVEAITSNAVTAPFEYHLWQWDTASGKALEKVTYRVDDAATDPYPGGKPVFSPAGDLLAVPLTNGSIDLRKARTGERAGTLDGHSGVVTATTFNADGTMLASGGSDRTVRLWDVAGRRPVGTALTGHNGVVHGAAFLPDGTTLASVGDNDTAVRLWDLPRHAPLAGLTASSSWFAIAAQPGTGLVATAGINNVVGVWSLDVEAVRTRVCADLGGEEPVADQWTDATGHDADRAPRC
ncbi:MAG: DNA-binding protein, partial [Saccharothrix sp.]|nr:DNA-binding protein [Saccharothrix sp.]